MEPKRYSNIIAFDDAPFSRLDGNTVKVVGAVYAGLRFDGVLVGEITRDGDDAARCLAALIDESKFRHHVQLIMLQGIAMGGFNVVDAFSLERQLRRPVLIVARKRPDMAAVRNALLHHGIPKGEKKWRLIEALGPMEPVGGVFVQRVGISLAATESLIARFAVHSRIPEPIRSAHLIAGALTRGQSSGHP